MKTSKFILLSITTLSMMFLLSCDNGKDKKSQVASVPKVDVAKLIERQRVLINSDFRVRNRY